VIAVRRLLYLPFVLIPARCGMQQKSGLFSSEEARLTSTDLRTEMPVVDASAKQILIQT